MEPTTRAVVPCTEHQTTTWAVQPEVLHQIANHLIKRPSAELLAAVPQAASADVPVTGGVAVISLRGLITARPSLLSMLLGGGGGLRVFRSALREAVASEEIGSILLDIDSPGGSTDLNNEVAAEIRSFRGSKPIIALANTVAASAAYCIASAADEVVVTPSGRVGSIGTYLLHLDWSKFNDDAGIKPTYISAGKYKVEGNEDEPLEDEARAALQEMVDDYYALFVADVAAGRGVSTSAVRSGFGEGRIVTAAKAVEVGLADRVASFESVVSKLAGTGANGGKTTSLHVALDAAAPTSTSPTKQPEDKPTPKGQSPEEERARIARLATARPTHTTP